jgi:hypothetical protein
MPEIGTSGLMSGVGNRDGLMVGTAPDLDSTSFNTPPYGRSAFSRFHLCLLNVRCNVAYALSVDSVGINRREVVNERVIQRKE